MRKAQEFVEEYRRKGYPDERIRIIASMRPEPMRSEVLNILGAKTEESAAPEPAPVEAQEDLHQEPAEPEAVEVKTLKRTAKKETPSESGEIESLRKGRERMVAELEKANAALEKARAESESVKELRRRVAEMESLRKALDQTRDQRRELNAEKAKIESALADLEAKLVEKEALLAEKDQMIGEMENSLAAERTQREDAVARAGELAAVIEKQTERLSEFDDLNQQLSISRAALEKLRSDASRLQESEQAKAERIAELESQSADVHEQIVSNEQALEELQENLSSRESELETLREHFDLEANDLKKRAEQEMWLLHRRLSRVHKLAALGSALAACVVVAVSFLYIGALNDVGRLERNVAALEEQERAGRAFAGGTIEHRPGPMRIEHESPEIPDVSERSTAPHLPMLGIRPEQPGIEDTTAPPMPTVGPEQPATQVITYTMRKGESLWTISEQYLGSGVHWKQIARENGIPEAEARKLKPGTVLRITVPADH